MKDKLLKLLMEADDYLSGEALSQTLGVSRTAVWKAVNKLKEQGYAISSVRNKGYLIQEESSELIESAVKNHLPKGTLFHTVKVYESLDSTNSEAKRLWQNGLKEPALILSREQTAGKGRRGRTWLSPKDDGVFMTMLLMPDIEPIHASMLTLIAGLAVAQAVKSLTSVEAMIKWPNDLVINGKKTCGILTEMSAEMDYVHHVEVGIGINVNQVAFDQEIVDSATSIRANCGQIINRPRLIGAVVEAFEALYSQFVIDRNLNFMLEAYNEQCINVGKELKVLSRNDVTEGLGIGITEDGTLQIRLKDGTITTVNAGEVSVRGLYGYI